MRRIANPHVIYKVLEHEVDYNVSVYCVYMLDRASVLSAGTVLNDRFYNIHVCLSSTRVGLMFDCYVMWFPTKHDIKCS